ncbi:MAG: HNH endonuclease [Lentisphaerae bacterium]|nr:HNH endonuclease [Lentisphaerota bacterium]MBT5608565.1 HNH endonuclease [Lentisphaerota bacterium]
MWLCRCKCGGRTVVSTGRLRSNAVQSCGCLQHRRGEDHPNWRTGVHITQDGYREVPVPGSTDSHRYRAEHRFVAERMVGRTLHPWEVVHHRNRDRQDNRPENLQVLSRRDHAALHAREDRACSN